MKKGDKHRTFTKKQAERWGKNKQAEIFQEPTVDAEREIPLWRLMTQGIIPTHRASDRRSHSSPP